jgi:hypothetical protein
LFPQFIRERLIYRPIARVIGISPQAVRTVSVIRPAGMVGYRIKTYPRQRNPGRKSDPRLLANIS